MPLVPSSDYQSPLWLKGGHLQTIVPSLARKSEVLSGEAERLELEDGDYLDLVWHRTGQSRLAVLCHGLEAHLEASYIQEMAASLVRAGWDVLTWSYRGCSGEMNRLPRFYHSGATEDLGAVINHALESHSAARLDLLGFSLGGNLILKYLGEVGAQGAPRLGRAVAFSVPCDLASSAAALDTAFNREVYMRRFIKSLAEKVRQKRLLFPDDSRLDPAGLDQLRTFKQFDSRYTAPLHGFDSAEDYWSRSSSRPLLAQISIPALLVNASNDPFLGPGCFPRDEAAGSEFFYLEMPSEGGHVGFPGGRQAWMPRRAIRFLTEEA